MKVKLNKQLPDNVVKAVINKDISKLVSTEKLLANRIMQILKSEGIWDWFSHYPLMPTGSLEEMLAGKTQPLINNNYLLYVRYHATISNKEKERRTKRLLLAFPQYFELC